MPVYIFPTEGSNTSTSAVPPQSNVTNVTCAPCKAPILCQTTVQKIIVPPVLARVKISWKKGSQCAGLLYLSSSDQREAPLCYTPVVQKWSSKLCKDTRCGEFVDHKITSEEVKGYFINSNMTLSNASCQGVHIICQGVCFFTIKNDQIFYTIFIVTDYCFFSLSDSLGKELAAYKAVTGILLFLILSVILLQFSRPTYKAIRKRCESLMKTTVFEIYVASC